jgi:hypothetical protein
MQKAKNFVMKVGVVKQSCFLNNTYSKTLFYMNMIGKMWNVIMDQEVDSGNIG